MSILLSLQAVGAQTAEQMPDLTAVTVPTEAEINVIDLAFKGGWIMVVLLLLSLMAGYIFIQRLLVIRRAGKEDQNFMNRIKDYIHEGKVDSALQLPPSRQKRPLHLQIRRLSLQRAISLSRLRRSMVCPFFRWTVSTVPSSSHCREIL